jgi:predicted transcriptional regulator
MNFETNMKFEQPPIKEKHVEEYEKAKRYFRELFISQDHGKLDEFYSEIRSFAGLVNLDPELIIEEIKNGLKLENPEEFVDLVFKVLKKVIDQRIEHPEIFERTRRERIIERSGNIRLSELMYYNIDLENGTAIIHVAPKGDLKLGAIIKAFRDGLKELARQVKEDERIKEIQATSWIVASNPGLLEKAGFTVEGTIDEKMKTEHFSDENRPVSWAYMSREKLLEKYLN